jgi:hypothetical protein
MSWKPILNLTGPTGPPGPNCSKFKSGRSLVATNVITFGTPYPDANYVIALTPYIHSTSNHVPQAWVIIDSVTPNSFRFNSVGADGVFWTTIYESSS